MSRSQKKLFDIVKSAIQNKKWVITCPSTDCNGDSVGIREDASKYKFTASCANCDFEMGLPLDWSRLSSSKTIDYLNENIACPSRRQMRSWIMGVKYTHPTYFISQAFERDKAKPEVLGIIEEVLRKTEKETSEVVFAAIGANNCYELNSLPDGWAQENIFALDPAEDALNLALANFPRINAYGAMIEQPDEFESLTGKPFPDREADICIAFRSMQSSGLSLWGALSQIRNKVLKKGGHLVISIPQRTINIMNNVQEGTFKSGKFDRIYPRETVEEMARAITEIDGSGYFENVRLYYGNQDSMEYYLVAEAT